MRGNIETTEQFLKSCGATLKIENRYPDEYADNESPCYRYVITRKGKQLSGLYSSKLCKKPTVYDILKDLPMHEPEVDLWDFAKRHEESRTSSETEDILALIKGVLPKLHP